MNRDRRQGNRKQVVGQIQERYGAAQEEPQQPMGERKRWATDAWFNKN